MSSNSALQFYRNEWRDGMSDGQTVPTHEFPVNL